MTSAPAAPLGFASPRLAPVDSDERLHTLDILRGLALPLRPLEWLWRSATYWRCQPLRREALSYGNSI
jgi:uncharacterized membrane protein YeiB